MRSRHSLLRRLSWHPLVAGLVLAWFVYSVSTRPPTAMRITGLVITSIWLALAAYDWLTSHRLLDWLYGDHQRGGGDAGTPTDDDENAQRAQLWHDHKSALMERALGKEHDMVMHAIIPYAVGGTLDLYYFPNGIPGTAIATKEMSELPNMGSSNRVYKSYELVMFTRHALSLDEAKDPSTPFGRAHRNINSILNYIARYGETAQLNPGETCEFPAEMEQVGGKCLIFDGYGCYSDDLADNFGLLAIIEVFRSEMNFARQHGTPALLARLKERGHYPYSDLDRDAVA